MAVPPADEPPPAVHSLYDEAPCGLLMTRGDGRIEIANLTFCRWMGMTREELLGKRFQDLFNVGGRIFHQTHWAPLLQMQGSVAEVKLVLVHKDGHGIPMMLNAVRRDRDGEVRHELALFVAEDRNAYERELMLARKRAEQAQSALALSDARLRMALEAAQLYVWTVDPATGARRYDPRVALLLGHGAAREIESPEFFEAIEPADRAALLHAFERMTDGSTDLFRATYRLNGVDGVQRTVQSIARALVEADGGVRHIIGVLHDITELSARRAAAEDRALLAEQMIGIVSHDLRNPLSAILMGAAVLQRATLAEPFPKAVHHIEQSGRRAKRMIEDLLDFTMARIGRGIPVNVRPVELHRMVAGFVDELSQAHAPRVLLHETAGAGDCVADPDRFYQLVGNLVSNAITYGDAARPVTVASRVGADAFELSVHNFGPPIPPALLPTLFQPMVRGEHPDSHARSVGLGLYIVSEIARAHGGEVGVASDADAGTRFTVAFPRA